MPLREKLGLKKRVDPALSFGAAQIKGVEAGLSKPQAKALALGGSAQAVVSNLTALKGRVEPGLHDAKVQEMSALAARIASGGKDGDGFAMDVAQLKLLEAETNQERGRGKDKAAKVAAAQESFGSAFAARFAADGDLNATGDMAADMAAYVQDLAANDRDAELQAALRGLDVLRSSADPVAKAAARDASLALAKARQNDAAALPRSLAPRDAVRTPNDVLVHLMSVVREAAARNPKDAALKKVAADGRALFMEHTLSLDAVNDLLDAAEDALADLDDDAGGQCATLRGQLPDSEDAITVPQQQENLYGRVFDTKLVSALVADPPDTLLAAMGDAGAELNKALPDTNLGRNAAWGLVKKAIVDDQRSWSAGVPGFADMAAATNPAEAMTALRKFLTTPPTSGPELVAFPYVLAKLSLQMKNCGVPAPWLDAANQNYQQVIQTQAVREPGAYKGSEPVSEGAGITLLHQPPAESGGGLQPSVRPGTVNRFGNRDDFDSTGPEGQGKGLDEVERTEAIELAHDRNLPFASGVSGTTNILMHLLKHQKDQGVVVDATDFLMSSMMFLVYDGGHSVHEVMWTANQLDAKLGLGLGLGDPSKPNEFVSDYDGIAAKLGGETGAAFGQAMGDAWDGTQDYLKDNSYFAQPGDDEDDDEDESSSTASRRSSVSV